LKHFGSARSIEKRELLPSLVAQRQCLILLLPGGKILLDVHIAAKKGTIGSLHARPLLQFTAGDVDGLGGDDPVVGELASKDGDDPPALPRSRIQHEVPARRLRLALSRTPQD